MNNKPQDLAVKTGTYTDSNGQTKNRYENIGKLMHGNDGPYILLKRTFNPAGVAVDPGRDMIVVSVFEQRESAPRDPGPSPESPPQRSAVPHSVGTNEDIPF